MTNLYVSPGVRLQDLFKVYSGGLLSSRSIPTLALYYLNQIYGEGVVLDRPSFTEFKRWCRKKAVRKVFISTLTRDLDTALEWGRVAESLGKKVLLGGYGVLTPDERLRGFETHVPSPPPMDYGEIPFASFWITYRGLGVPPIPVRFNMLASSYGCPYHCRFCETGGMDWYQVEPYEKVLSVLERSGRFLFFCDDTFLYEKKRFEELSGALSNKRYFVLARATDLKRYSPQFLYESGLRGVYLGFERRDNVKARVSSDIARDYAGSGIRIQGSFILCWPDQDIEDVYAEIDWAFEQRVSLRQFSLFTPLPSTPYWNELELRNVPWSHYDLAHLVFEHDSISPEQARDVLLYAYSRQHSLLRKKPMEKSRVIVDKWLKQDGV